MLDEPPDPISLKNRNRLLSRARDAIEPGDEIGIGDVALDVIAVLAARQAVADRVPLLSFARRSRTS
jgi:hypothetical protein